MLSTLQIEGAKTRFLFVTHIVITSEIIDYYLRGKEIFTETWLYSAFSFLLAYVIFTILADDLEIVNKNNHSIKKHERNFFRFAVLFLVSHLIRNYLEHGFVGFQQLYLIKVALILIGYVIPDYLLQDILLKFNSHQILLYDVIKMFTVDYIVVNLIYNVFTLNDFYESFSFSASYILWETLTKKFLT